MRHYCYPSVSTEGTDLEIVKLLGREAKFRPKSLTPEPFHASDVPGTAVLSYVVFYLSFSITSMKYFALGETETQRS